MEVYIEALEVQRETAGVDGIQSPTRMTLKRPTEKIVTPQSSANSFLILFHLNHSFHPLNIQYSNDK